MLMMLQSGRRIASHACCWPAPPTNHHPPAKPSSAGRGIEVEVRPSRLGLARVSVLRGQGPAKGTACIDDYIKVGGWWCVCC